ncbi:hypothetical protein D0Z03_002585 [Geotrichum reessii]|nr:hypothetical protein D0Z03_002585 [Galactomyces reessii]
MKFSTTLGSLTLALSFAQAQQNIPSVDEAEGIAQALYGSNPAYSSLLDYYATHSFTTGTKLQSWMSKVDQYQSKLDDSGEMSPKQLNELYNEVYGDFPTQDYANFIEQYYPTSILGTAGLAAALPSMTIFPMPTGFSEDMASTNTIKESDTKKSSVAPGSSPSRSNPVTTTTSAAQETTPASSKPDTTVSTSSLASAVESTPATTAAANGAATISVCAAAIFGVLAGLTFV